MEEKVKHIQTLLRALVYNKKIVDKEEKVFWLDEVGLKSEHKAVLSRVSLEELEDYNVYIDPKDTEIERLRATIESQNKVIQDMVKKKNEKPERKKHVRLTAVQKAEMAQAVVDKPSIQNTELAETYNTSTSNVGKILDEMKVRSIKKRT